VNMFGKELYLAEVRVPTYNPGTTKITVMANDGSKKSCSFTLKVTR